MNTKAENAEMWNNINFDEPNRVFQSVFFTFALLLKYIYEKCCPKPCTTFLWNHDKLSFKLLWCLIFFL